MDKIICLKEIFDEGSIKQKVIAEKLGVDISSVMLWMMGKTKLTILHLLKIAKVLNVDVSLIINGKEEWR